MLIIIMFVCLGYELFYGRKVTTLMHNNNKDEAKLIFIILLDMYTK